MQVLQKVWPLGPGLQKEPCKGFPHFCIETKAVRKKEGPVTLALVALDPALPSKEDTNEGALPPPPHLIVPVDLRKG
jgi:hypothetical protein